MTDTTIRVSKETKRRLDLRKREGESYEDVIRRLTESDKWAGFGALADAEGSLREGTDAIRRELRDGMASDVEEIGERLGSAPSAGDGEE